jgi:ABC-2 type transport system ATP-binding protein
MTAPSPSPSIETSGLGKQYGQLWALQDCSLHVPTGRVTALLGPNGAGKTTLLRLLVGLASPSAGSAQVLGRAPDGSEEFLAEIGYLAQDVPLYRRLSAEDHIELGAHLNARWDAAGARDRLDRLHVPMDRPVATLSGGQRAQVALGLALAKQPGLLLLDEPVAALDPLARREFLLALSEAVAEGDVSVILSSHLVHDLERVCDHVILMSASRVQLCSDIDTVLETHRMLLGPRRSLAEVEPGLTVISATQTQRQTRLLVRTNGPVLDPSWEQSEVGLEDVILAYMGNEAAGDAAAATTATPTATPRANRHLEVAP